MRAQAQQKTLEVATKKKHVTKTIRIGVVTTSFPLFPGSSSGVFVQRLVSHMPASVDITVLAPSFINKMEESANKNYSVTTFSYGPKKLQRLSHRPGGIPDAIRRKDPVALLLPLLIPAMFIASFRLAGKVDVIHGNWSAPGFIAALAAKLRRKPAIATLRGEDANRAVKSLLFRFVLWACLKINDHCVVVSEALLLSLQQQYPKMSSKISFIPNGVLISSAPTPREFSIPLRIITVANLIRRKQIHTLIEAFAILKRNFNIELQIIGDGPDRTDLQKLANRLLVNTYIEFAGNVAPEKVEDHLRQADIFVLPSESEGRPNALLEAMAMGLPVIASDIDGVRELLEESAGLLFPVGDVAQLATCIEQMIMDPKAARLLGQNAKSKILSANLDWNCSAKRYADLYESIRRKSCAA